MMKYATAHIFHRNSVSKIKLNKVFLIVLIHKSTWARINRIRLKKAIKCENYEGGTCCKHYPRFIHPPTCTGVEEGDRLPSGLLVIVLKNNEMWDQGNDQSLGKTSDVSQKLMDVEKCHQKILDMSPIALQKAWD